MTAEILDADTFKRVVCAIHPYVQKYECCLPETTDRIGQDQIHDCILSANQALKDGSTLEEFCQQTDQHLLRSVGEFCLDMWPKLRFEERGLA